MNLRCSRSVNPLIVTLSLGLLLGVVAPSTSAQVTQEWISGFNGPASDEEDVRDLVTRDGFVYVTGWTTAGFWRAYFTVKYDAAGQEVWSRLYTGSPQEPDEAEALVVDADGNVYVTGWSSASEGFDSYVDIVTLKYSPAGDVLWTAQYRTAGGNNQPSDMILGDDGFLYIAGASWDENVGFRALLLKLDRAGNLIWDETLDHGSGWDVFYTLTRDAAGNIVGVGYTDLIVNNAAWLVAKYSDTGQLSWVRTRDGFSTADEAESVATDALGNVYVTGDLSPPASALDIHTMKFSPAGAVLWERTFAGPEDNNDYASTVSVDSTGDVIVAGSTWLSMLAVKYSAAGQLQWARQFNDGLAYARTGGMTLDSHDNVYLTGYGYSSAAQEDYLTIKYSPAGDPAWSQRYVGPGGRGDYGKCIAVDAQQNVFVAGDSWISFPEYYNALVVAYSQTLAGDLNCDGALNAADVDPFVLAVTDPDAYAGQYPDCDRLNADVNGDGTINASDIDPFVALLTGL